MILRKFKKYLFHKLKFSSETQGITFICSCKPLLSIGLGTNMNGVKIYCWDSRMKITIGSYCSFADAISIIGGGEHDKNWISTYPFIELWNLEDLEYIKKPRYKGSIEIGSDVWIAHGVTILSGVSIGHGAVIGAESVVTKNIPPYSIAVGNPARVIKYRFAPEIILELLQIRWWEWDKDSIKASLKHIDNIEEFVTYAKSKSSKV